jgi:hypothetical protein
VKYQFFFVGADGIVKHNDELMPIDVVRDACPKGPVLRFAFDQQENKIYIQDESFREGLSKGDECAWHLINHALYALEEQTGCRFPKREFGDPIDSAVLRTLSQYPEAWIRIQRVMDDLGAEPIDLPVYEYVAPKERASETVVFLPVGSILGDHPAEKPTLGVNRMIHKAVPDMADGPDIDYKLMSMALQCFYMDNLKTIMKAVGTPEAQAVLDASKNTKLACRMFAMDMNGKTRIFKATPDDDGKFPTEEDVKKKLPTYQGPVVMFDWDHRGSVTLKNALPSKMFSDQTGQRMSSDIKKAFGRIGKIPIDEISFSLDPALDSPYAYDSKVISNTLGCLCEGDRHIPVDFIEVPGLDETSVSVSNPEEEERLIPGFQSYRATRGIDITYPFVALRAEMTRGKKLGEMSRKYRELRGDQDNKKGLSFIKWITDEAERTKLVKRMSRMLTMGFSKSDILDVFSSETDLLRRAEYGLVLDEACDQTCPKKVALAGHPIGVNDWWHIVVPEALNLRSEDKKPRVKPLNPEPLQAVPPEKAGIETLLERDRDERASHKPMETLLRESML